MTARRVSLSRELDLIQGALSSARQLTERFFEEPRHLGQLQGLPWNLRACLLLIEARLRHLDRVIRGVADPELLWLRETAEEGEPDPDESNITLSWSERDRIRHLKAELQRARRRRRHHRRLQRK